MMGVSHATTGAAAWIALASTAQHFPALGLYPVEPIGVVTGAVVAAGAALLPDADHPNATIAYSVPVAGKALAGTVGALTGGHRHGMHSLLAVAASYFGSLWLAGNLTWQPQWWYTSIHVGVLIATIALMTFAFKVLKIVKSWPKAWLSGLISGSLVTLFVPQSLDWFPVAVALGYFIHLIGDMMTVEGVPFLWPFVPKPPKSVKDGVILKRFWTPGGHLSIPVLGHAGSIREQVLIYGVSIYALWGICVAVYDIFV